MRRLWAIVVLVGVFSAALVASPVPGVESAAASVNAVDAGDVCSDGIAGGRVTLPIPGPGIEWASLHVPIGARVQIDAFDRKDRLASGNWAMNAALFQRRADGTSGYVVDSRNWSSPYYWRSVLEYRRSNVIDYTNPGPGTEFLVRLDLLIAVSISASEGARVELENIRITNPDGSITVPCTGPSEVAWDVVSEPTMEFPYCVATADGGSITGSCFQTESGATAAIVQRGHRRGLDSPNDVGGRTTLAVPSCGAAWISLTGTIFDGRESSGLTSSCPLVLTTNGAPHDPVVPSKVDVLFVETLTGLPMDSTPANWSRGRVMFLDPENPAGEFSSDDLWFLTSRDRPVTAEADDVVSLVGSGVEGDVRVQATEVAYASGQLDADSAVHGSRGLDVLFWPPDGSVFLWPDVPEELRSEDPDLAEFDLVWAWANDESGGPDQIDTGEKFDVLLRPVLQPLRMVSVGDSYAAGEGATAAELHRCSRSPYAYTGSTVQIQLFDIRRWGNRLREVVDATEPADLNRTGNGVDWSFVACTGAQSFNLWADGSSTIPRDPRNDEAGVSNRAPLYPYFPPDDVTQLANPAVGDVWEPNAVTITMGGNDSGFAPLLTACIAETAYVRTLFLDPETLSLSVCEYAFVTKLAGINPVPDDALRGLTSDEFFEDVVRLRLRHTYEEIKAAIPRADSGEAAVTVFGYPTLFQSGCAISAFLGPKSVDWLEEVGLQLNSIIESEATAAGFAFVDPAEFAGHSICADDPYLNSILVENISDRSVWDIAWNGPDPDTLIDPADQDAAFDYTKSVHPNDAGWQAYADGWVRINQGSGDRLANGLLVPAGSPLRANALAAVAASETEPDLSSFLSVDGDGSIGLEASPVCASDAVVAVGGTVTAEIEAAEPGQEANLIVVAMSPGPVEVATASGVVSSDGAASLTLMLDDPSVTGQMLAFLVLGDEPGGVVEFEGFDLISSVRSCAEDDAVVADAGTDLVLADVLVNDDPGSSGLDPASLEVVSGALHGTASFDGTTLSYVPAAGFAHFDSVTYRVCDFDDLCSEATVTLDLTGGCAIVGHGAGLLSGTDADDVICGSPSFEIIEAMDGHDVVYPGGGGDRIDAGRGGGIVFVSDDTSTVVATSEVEVIDPAGVAATVIVEDGRPLVSDDMVEVGSPSAVVRPLLNDAATSAIDPATFKVMSLPAEVSIESVVMDGGGLRVLFSSSSPVVSAPIAYRVCDVEGRCDSGFIRLTTGDNTGTAPTAVDDEAVIDPAATVLVNALGNDLDADGDLDERSLTIAVAPDAGEAVVVDGLIRFDAPIGFSGETSVSYWVCDLAGQCAQGQVTIIVEPYAFGGFESPVRLEPEVNLVRSGRSIPIKFSLGGDYGLDIIIDGYPASGVVACGEDGEGVELEQTVTPGSAELSYDPTTGLYSYVWKTERSWSGSCRVLMVEFIDGTTQLATFEFR